MYTSKHVKKHRRLVNKKRGVCKAKQKEAALLLAFSSEHFVMVQDDSHKAIAAGFRNTRQWLNAGMPEAA
jgi:hypothetical protein